MDDDEPRRLGGELRSRHGVCHLYGFDGGVHVIDVAGLLTVGDLRPTIDPIYRDPSTLLPHAVVFRGGPGADHDRSVLTFYQQDVPRPNLALVGVVTRRPMMRMITMATALGFRASMRAPLTSHDDLIGALVAARLALTQAG